MSLRSRVIDALKSLPTAGRDQRGVLIFKHNDGADDHLYVGRRLSGGSFELKQLTAAVSSYTDEQAQDAVGGICIDSASIDFTYSDATPSITAEVKYAGTGAASTAARSDHDHDADYAAAVHAHAAGDITSGTIATARLGSGTADLTTFLRGDQSWATPSGGSAPVVQRNDTTIAAAADTFDFSLAFSVAESPSGEANIGIDTRSVSPDFGSTPRHSGSFTLTDADLTSSHRLLVWNVARSGSDEEEMDGIIAIPQQPGSGSATIFWHAIPGPVIGVKDFRYLILGA